MRFAASGQGTRVVRRVKIYTDGAADNTDSSRGAWAYVMVEKDGLIEKSGIAVCGNGNRLKMMAMIEAVQRVNDLESKPDEVILYSDSEYCVEAFSGRRQVRRHHRNADLVDRFRVIMQAFQREGITVRLEWIKRNRGDPFIGRARDVANTELKGDQECDTLYEFFA
jgi:ribonuclease HI